MSVKKTLVWVPSHFVKQELRELAENHAGMTFRNALFAGEGTETDVKNVAGIIPKGYEHYPVHPDQDEIMRMINGEPQSVAKAGSGGSVEKEIEPSIIADKPEPEPEPELPAGVTKRTRVN